jgi:hypothetical protein
MIRWPSERFGSRAVRAGLALFRATAAARELDEDAHAWILETSSWTDEAPTQLVWRSEEGAEACFTYEESGVWMLAPFPSELVAPKTSDSLTPLGVP